MSVEYDELWKQLAKMFRDGGFKGSTLIPFCPLSSFFDFLAFASGAFTDAEERAVRYGHLAFACVVTSSPGSPLLIATIVREDDEFAKGSLRVLRKKVRIEPIVWNARDSAYRLVEAVRARLDEGIEPVELAKCPATVGAKANRETSPNCSRTEHIYD
jgi:hypothetical protein